MRVGSKTVPGWVVAGSVSTAMMLAIFVYRGEFMTRAAMPGQITKSAEAASASTYGTEIVLTAERDGHFYLDAEVDRSHIRFMIDTGASITVISPDDAADLRIDVERLEASQRVYTGGGEVQMAPVTLPYIESGHLRVHNVDALATTVDMPYSVLGMSFLGRLRSYHAEGDTMVLVP